MSNRTGMYGRPAGFATSVGVMEPVPADAFVDEDQAHYGGTLFFNLEEGRAGCSRPSCGWSGVPTVVHGVISTWCPKCQPGKRPATVIKGRSPGLSVPELPLVGEKPGAAAQRRKAERNARRHARRKGRKR